MPRSHRIDGRKSFGVLLLLVFCLLAPRPAGAENIKIGILKSVTYGPFFIAQEKGYFAAEGLSAELSFFMAGPALPPALASGAIDFAAGGTSAALFNLAGQGMLRIIAGFNEEVPGFKLFAVVVSNHAYEAGLRSYRDLPGHSVAITQFGGPPDYSLALIEQKYHLDPKTIRRLPTQSIPSTIAAVVGGQADSAVINATPVAPSVQRGDLKILGYIGDETPWQLGVVFTTTKTANERESTVRGFLRALHKGTRDYTAAFIDPNGKRKDGPTAPEILAILSKHLGQSAKAIDKIISYADPDGRIDVKDILHQIDWYKSQGMIKGPVNADDIIDRRYAVPLPQR